MALKPFECSYNSHEEQSIAIALRDLKRKGRERFLKDTEEIVILETAARDMNRQMRTDTGTEGSGKNRSVKKAQGERTVQDLKNLLLLHGQDILFAPGMQREKDFMQHGKVSVFEHSVGVTLVSLMLAEKFNMKVDTRALVRGSLLHDYFLYDWHDYHPEVGLHGFTHAKIAMENACRDFDLNEIEKDMIARHMFPLNLKPPKYRESRILCIADKMAAACETFRIPYLAEVIKELREAL